MGAGDNLVAEHVIVQSLQLVTESLQKEGERVRGIEEKQEMLTKELVGLKDEMKKNFEVLERLCQQKDIGSRQQVDQAIDRRRVAAMRRTSRPLLLNRTGRGIPDQQGLTPSPMILPRPDVIAPGNNPSPKPIFLKARNNASISSGSSVPSKVARVLPSRPMRSPHLCGRGTSLATSNAKHALQQPLKMEVFDVFALDSDSDQNG